MTPSQPKFAYFGTPYVSRDTLEILAERGFVPTIIVTSPDALRGRGMKLTPSETKEWALAHDVPVLTPQKITRDVIASLAEYQCEFAVVVAYGKILSQALIDSFPLGILNIHYSLLPKYRGASPVEAALLHGETVTGVTIQQMQFALDAGDILAQQDVAIDSNETTKELRPRLITIGAHLLADILPDFIAHTVTPQSQDHTLATHSGKINKTEGELTLDSYGSTEHAQENWNKYRAYAESPGTYFYATRGETRIRVKIKSAKFEGGQFIPLRVVPEGKSEQDFADFAKTISR